MASGQVSPKRGKVVDIPANAPTIGTATDLVLDGKVSVAFTAASTTTGGPIFSYTAVSNPGSITGTGTSSPITVSGLTNSTAYTFTVAGVNATGTGPFSAASNSATPTVPPNSFESIASVVGTGSASSLTFNSIPSIYKYLQIRGVARDQAGGNASSNLQIRFNGDSGANYWSRFIEGVGTNPPQASYNSGGFLSINRFEQGTASASGYMGVGIVDIYDYASTTKAKTVLGSTGVNDNGTVYNSTDIVSGVWNSTSAITSITLINGFGNNWNTDTVFSLYGVKG